MMINEEDLAGAALAGKEPKQQFRFIEQLAAKRLEGARDSNGEQLFDDYDYMSSVLEAARVFGIAELSKWKMPDRSGVDWRMDCRNFRAEATRVSQRILFEYATRPERDPNTVALDAATKERLRFHLNQVRGIIDTSAIPEWKKGELYEAISDLEREIDKARTRIAAVIDVLGKAWEGDVEVADALRQVVLIIQDAKEAEKVTAALGAPVEPKKLEAPRPRTLAAPKAKEHKKTLDQALDDEIPF